MMAVLLLVAALFMPLGEYHAPRVYRWPRCWNRTMQTPKRMKAIERDYTVPRTDRRATHATAIRFVTEWCEREMAVP